MLQGNTVMHTRPVKFTKLFFGKSAAGEHICCNVNFSQRSGIMCLVRPGPQSKDWIACVALNIADLHNTHIM